MLWAHKASESRPIRLPHNLTVMKEKDAKRQITVDRNRHPLGIKTTTTNELDAEGGLMVVVLIATYTLRSKYTD